MWRTCSSAADSTGNRLPEDGRLGRLMVEAARDGRADEVERLLDAGASPESGQASGYTALGLAANRGHYEVAELLLRRRASPDMPICTNDVTPLMVSCIWGRTDMVALLIDHRCSLDVKGLAGSYRDRTPLDVARSSSSPSAKAVTALLVRERAVRHWRRLARIAPLAGVFALALRELHSHVHYRPGAAGAVEAQRSFDAAVTLCAVVAADDLVGGACPAEEDGVVADADEPPGGWVQNRRMRQLHARARRVRLDERLRADIIERDALRLERREELMRRGAGGDADNRGRCAKKNCRRRQQRHRRTPRRAQRRCDGRGEAAGWKMGRVDGALHGGGESPSERARRKEQPHRGCNTRSVAFLTQ